MVQANGAKEKLNRAHDGVESAWAEFCEAKGIEIKARARVKLAADGYLKARKNWLDTVELCTPGEVEGENRSSQPAR